VNPLAVGQDIKLLKAPNGRAKLWS
jgi:hypothetical protein